MKMRKITKKIFNLIITLIACTSLWISLMGVTEASDDCCGSPADGSPAPKKCKCTGVGEKGDPGIRGAFGIPGEHGAIGPKGEKGKYGMLGDSGEKGRLGLIGLKGNIGRQGQPGPAGRDVFFWLFILFTV